MKQQTIFITFLMAVALFVITACHFPIVPPTAMPTSLPSTKLEIPFENIALNEWGVNDNMSRDPQLFIVMTANDVAKIQSFISDKALQEVQKTSWDEYAVIAVFRGLQGCSLFGIGIERVVIEDDTLFVDAEFWQPPPNYMCQTILTSPYHLVKIRKVDRRLERLKPMLRSRIVERADNSDQEKIGSRQN